MKHNIKEKKFLKEALRLARISFENNSNPIGAVIVDENGNIISKAYNKISIEKNVTAHAEIEAMKLAGDKIFPYGKRGREKAVNVIYTTLELCFGCLFFLTRTNIKKIVWLLDDDYKGGIKSLSNDPKLKDDFAKIELISEPFRDLKEEYSGLRNSWNEYVQKKIIEEKKL